MVIKYLDVDKKVFISVLDYHLKIAKSILHPLAKKNYLIITYLIF